MRPEQQTTIPENAHVQIMNLVLFCPIHNFRVVKHDADDICKFMQFYEKVDMSMI